MTIGRILMKIGRILMKITGICSNFCVEFDFDSEIGPNTSKSSKITRIEQKNVKI